MANRGGYVNTQALNFFLFVKEPACYNSKKRIDNKVQTLVVVSSFLGKLVKIFWYCMWNNKIFIFRPTQLFDSTYEKLSLMYNSYSPNLIVRTIFFFTEEK